MIRLHSAAGNKLIFSCLAFGVFVSCWERGPAYSEDAANGIAAWALQPMSGPAGRPLPLTGNWMCEDKSSEKGFTEYPHWGPAYMAEMVRRGHHVLPTFIDSFSLAQWRYITRDLRREEQVEAYKARWKPVLEYCRDNRLPIAIRGWNWDTYPMTYQEALKRKGDEIPKERVVCMLENGEPTRWADPMGPVDAWREVGTFWLGNPLAQWMRQIYPHPPLVILLNNNEAGKLHSWQELAAKSDRYRAKYGDDATDAPRVLEEGYRDLRRAMYDAARDASGSWKPALRTVAYNNLWNTMEVGRKEIDWPAEGYPLPEPWDGGMLELYDNDWQPGKTDFRTWSMQAEAMNCAGVLPDIFRQKPDFFWSTIAWDGGRPSNVYRPRGNPVSTTSKTYYYITRGQRWDQHRFEGWVQFGLWVQRPRLCFEFRGNPSRDPYSDLTWQAMVRAVDRPWNHPTLREFWQFGRLVPNREEPPIWQLAGDEPEWLRGLDRWFLLTSSANPPRKRMVSVVDLAEPGQRLPDKIVEEAGEWNEETRVRVWAVALVLGEVPRRRWMIYAHAPQGDVVGSTVRLPDHGEAILERIPVGGSFFLVDEAEGSVETLLEGAVGMGGIFWQPNAEGSESCVYDLALDEAFDWEGPWCPGGDADERLVKYRHVPNRGWAPPAVISGGRFVQDEQRGRVLELGGGEDGLWFIADKQTVMASPGHANRTISFWFNPVDVQTRQVLFAEGNLGAGMNIHIEGGQIHAGAWAPADALGWEGDWASSSEIQPNRWTHLALVLEDASEKVRAGRWKLYIDGSLASTASGVRMPRSYTPPRFGQPARNYSGRPITRFRSLLSKDNDVLPFRGRVDELRMLNEVEVP